MTTPGEITPVVRARKLTKTFRDFWGRPRVHAVRGIDFDVGAGEITGLLGPNGSGKSTTIKLIMGLLHPSNGELEVFDGSPRDVRVKRRIGYMPEESYLYKYLTAYETLNFYSRLFPLSSAERRERVDQLLTMTGLDGARNRAVGEFSKGMLRRVGLAQALINDPDLIVLDEPTAGLDPIACRQIKDLMTALANRGKTIIITSHLLADVDDVCDNLIMLYDGRVATEGRIQELLESRDRWRLTIPGVPVEQLDDLVARLGDELGEQPAVDRPGRTLEEFFLEVVNRAEQDGEVAAEVAHGTRLATFLDRAPPTGAAELGADD